MKKTLSIILSALMLAGMATLASASFEKGVDYLVMSEVDPDNYVAYGDGYPGSGDWDWPECTSGELLKGTIISSFDPETGYYCWYKDANGNFTTVGNASAAFDGDTATLYDPFTAGQKAWAGMILDQAYELTEARIMVRGKYLERMYNSAIQGSNDGENWVTIIFFAQNAEAEDYHILTPAPLSEDEHSDYYDAGYVDYSTYWVGSGSYSMYRYINMGGKHGEAVEIELYGNPAPATEVTEEYLASNSFSAVNFFNGSYETTEFTSVSVDGSITGTVIGAGGFYKDNADYGYEKAWDNDSTTFFDPSAQGVGYWTGIMVDAPVALKEVRVMPRAEWLDRTQGGHVQGSNDGKTWTTLASFTAEDCATEQMWIRKAVNTTKEFTMFRYVNNGAKHGDVVDVALFAYDGTPADIPEKPAPAETAAPETTAPVETAAPETTAPETTVPETAAPFVAPEGTVNLVTVGKVITSSANDVAGAFDGDLTTGIALGGAGKDAWLGIELDQPAILAVARLATYDTDGDGKTDKVHRLFKSVVEGSNDGENWEFILQFGDLYAEFEEFGADADELGVNYWAETAFDGETDEDDDATAPAAYKYYRVWNDDDNDFWGEVEFWATLVEATETTAPETEAPATEAPAETAAPETEAPAETTAPQTFDFGVIAAAAAVVSAAGYAIARKRK